MFASEPKGESLVANITYLWKDAEVMVHLKPRERNKVFHLAVRNETLSN